MEGRRQRIILSSSQSAVFFLILRLFFQTLSHSVDRVWSNFQQTEYLLPSVLAFKHGLMPVAFGIQFLIQYVSSSLAFGDSGSLFTCLFPSFSTFLLSPFEKNNNPQLYHTLSLNRDK